MGNTNIKDGSIMQDNKGFKFVVLKNYNHKNVLCKYILTGHVFTSQRSNVLRGACKDPVQPNDIGCYFGVGKFKESSIHFGRRIYVVWKNMVNRCLKKDDANYKRYGAKGVSVCKEWMCFQNFALWYVENYPSDGGFYEIDKDFYGKNLYSPDTCKFLTTQENILLANAKTYKIEFSDGRCEIVYSLSDYARRTKRSQSVLSRIASGEFKKRRVNKDILSITEVKNG